VSPAVDRPLMNAPSHPGSMRPTGRRLVAVMLTDMVGYTALTRRDESLALELLEEQHRLVRSLVERNGRGREIKTIGDACLAEFDSALDAVQCAIDVQRALVERNRANADRVVELRIGVHAGDVVHDENDVYGDAVNLVARIQPLASPGGICLTGPVFDQVRNRLSLPLTPMDVPSLKNIDTPVMLYRVELPGQRLGPGAETPWTGRATELATLRRLIDDGAEGKGRIVFVAGEAGIGKSRLARETANLARRRGFRVLFGRALPGELRAPYAPWIELCRQFLDSAPPQLVYRVCGTYGGELVKLLPDLVERIGPTRKPAAAAGPDEARLRLLEAVAQFFVNMARDAPLLLILDDLQAADAASLHLLQYVGQKVGGQRMLIVGTYRRAEAEDHPVLSDVVADLLRERIATELPLHGLSEADVHRMADELMETVAPGLARAVFAKTGGNPFFVEELIRSISEDRSAIGGGPGASPPGQPELRLPDTVRRVLRHRLSRLDETSLELLRLASVIGTDFSYDTLRAATDLPDEAVIRGIDAALQRRILLEQRGSAHRLTYRFLDREVRDLLYEEQSLLRRRQSHLRVARALTGGPAEASHVYELAYHYLAGNDLVEALRFAQRAAEEAERVHAREEANRQLRTILEILEVRPDDALRASILERLSESERLTGEMSPSLRHIEEATALRERLGDRPGAARDRLDAGYLYANAYYDGARAAEEFERARRLLDGLGDTVELGRVYLSLAHAPDRRYPSPDSRRDLEQALEIGRRLRDTPLETNALLHLLWSTPLDAVASVPGQLAEIEQLLSSAPGHSDISALRSYYTSAGWTAFQLEGDAAKGLALFRTVIARAKAIGAESVAMDVQGQDVAQALAVVGDLDDASRLAEETYAYAIRNYPTPDLANLVVLADIARMRGNLEKGRDLLSRAYDLGQRSLSVVMRIAPATVLARILLDGGQPGEAVQVAHRGLRPFLEDGLPITAIASVDYAELLTVAVECAARNPGPARDLTLLSQVRSELRRIAENSAHRPTRAFLSDAEGIWALREGRFGEAARALRDAAEAWLALGWKPYQARSLARLALALAESGDAVGAKGIHDQAMQIFRAIGATGEAQRWSELRPPEAAAAAPPSKPPAEASS
jgi:predicted ATPase/class 3 adenylate cyclase